MGSSYLSELQNSGAFLHTQNTRILKHRFPDSSNIPEGTLLPLRLVGEEGLSRNFLYRLECASVSAFVQHKDFFGQPIEVSLLLPDGSERLFTGLVTQVESKGSDGGFALWSLTIEPALAVLAHRRNSRVFQSKSVIEIVSAILDEHIAANPAFAASFKYESRVTQDYPQRSYCLQYRETDLAFIERLLAEEGISYRYVHGADPDHSIRAPRDRNKDNGETPTHTLILFDSGYAHQQSPVGTVRFHRTDGVETEDAVDKWEGSRQLQSGSSSLNTFDYKTVSQYPVSSEQYTQHGDGGSALTSSLDSYDPQTLYYGDPSDMERYAENRQRARDLASKFYYGGGTDRSVQDGVWKELQDHPVHDQDNQEDRQFLVLSHQFEARNNLLADDPPALGSLLGTSDSSGQNEPPYRNTFTAVRRHIPVVPAYEATKHQKPTAGGLTTATVVGPANEEIFTDALGRIKIQFHWQRPKDHPEGGANYDDNSSTWVRVAYASAGAQWGTQKIPRIGQEVIVSFIENDIDRPIVIGVVHNGTHTPPTFSGAGALPANKTLSGIKTKEYKGNAYNELLFDDSTNQVRAKLSSEHGKTQLNQGYLIHPRTEGKGEPRGEGLELRTDEAGAIRAAKGLLLSTDARLRAEGKQLDRQEALALLEAAQNLAQTLGDLAAKQLANLPETGKGNQLVKEDKAPGESKEHGHQHHLRQAIEAWEKGTNTDKTAKVSADNKQSGQQPAILMTAPAGIAAATAGSMTLTTGTNLDQVAQRDTNQTSGRRWIHNAGESISHFVRGTKGKIALKHIAANGNIQTQAQSGEIEITGDKTVTVTSVGDSVHVNAAKEILLTCGGAFIRISGGNIEVHAPGKVSVKGAKKIFSGPDSLNVPPPALPHGDLAPSDLAFRLVDPWGRPVPGASYKAILSDGTVKKGVLDQDGAAKLADVPSGTAKIIYGDDPRPATVETSHVVHGWDDFLGLNATLHEAPGGKGENKA